MKNNSMATKTINGIVAAGSAPSITVNPTFEEVTKTNLSYNVLTGVSASDAEDGSITNRVVAKINGNTVTTIDRNVQGVYNITYEVTDLDGNRTTATRTVLVNDGSYKAGNTTDLYFKPN